MAALRTHDGILAFTSGNSIAVSNIRTPDAFHIIGLPAGAENTPAKPEEEDSIGVGAGAGEGSSGCGSLKNRALASGFSGCGRYFAVCDDLKRLHVFDTHTLPWTRLSSRLLARRATSLTFTLDAASILVADKSGDLYSFPTLSQGEGHHEVPVKDGGQVENGVKVKEGEGQVKDGSEGKTEGRLLLGHLSMVLDMCLAESDRFVVTGDRDEKIRISHYPNGYNIHAFCLGHTQFVSCLHYVEEFGVLISGSGDGSLRVWNMQGKQLCQASLPEKRRQPSLPVTAEKHPPTPSLLAQGEEGMEDEDEEEERKGEEEEREQRAIRGLVYSRACRLLCVASYRRAEVEVYELTKEGEGNTTTPTTPSLTHLQTLSTPHPPWDMSWDESHRVLWVLCPVEGATLSAFRLRAGEGSDGVKAEASVKKLDKVVDTEEDSEGLAATLRTVNASWTFFKESMNVPSDLPGLWKTCSQENVIHYQRRKQQRLQSQQQQPQSPQPSRKSKKRRRKGKDKAGKKVRESC